MSEAEIFDAVVVGGGPAGATAAADLARLGRSVLLLDRAGRIKPCGGAIPPVLVREFGIPEHLIVARATGARVVAPSEKHAHMPIEGGYVGMVDREVFDEWLRERAVDRRRDPADRQVQRGGARSGRRCRRALHLRRRGPRTACAPGRSSAPTGRSPPSPSNASKAPSAIRYVFAYHEIVRAPVDAAGWDRRAATSTTRRRSRRTSTLGCSRTARR